MASHRKLKISNEVQELISRLHPNLKQKIRVALLEMIENPSCGKSLRRELQAMRSFRVSKFRIVYSLASNAIEIIALGPRRSIYEETLRLVRNEEQG
ncbi:MAG: type II toxin-antitoxin system RelE/ParE family toxin [Deltaproteobacteria bacterium]|nr:type II toxin-antitoxin system RelE/ParE family toxin [Deltaproteobacteria bacterium]